MKNFAVIDSDNTIINLIVADSQDLAEELTGKTCVEYNLSEQVLDLSWTYDGAIFIAPAIEEPVPLDPPIPTEHPESIPGVTKPD